MTDATLQKYEDKQVAKVSKLQKKADSLKVKAEKLAVKNDQGIVTARNFIKEVNTFKKEVEALRKEYTDPLNDVIKQLIAMEKKVVKPLDDAKNIAGEKILSYEEELEMARQAEAARIDNILDRFSEIVHGDPVSKTVEDVDAKGKKVKEYYGSLDKKDQALASVKLALTTSVDRLTDMKNHILQREVSEKEQADRQKEIAKAELQAEKEAVKDERAMGSRPKTGAVTLTKFEITDPNDVPRDLCSPDESKIRQSIKNGSTDIPGVRIYTEKKVR